MHFLQKCDNIYQTKTLIHFKICHCYILGLLLTVCHGNKLLLSLSEAFFPQQISDFEMAPFFNLSGFLARLKLYTLQKVAGAHTLKSFFVSKELRARLKIQK